ncbi:MAG: ABC transporter permease [Bacteroidia bacterium]|nr:ABC transporter permease [Bacteroidia bacterium]
MNLVKLAWKNIIHNPLTLILNLVLLCLGIGLINFILLLNTQLKDKFDKNLAEIDLVIGAKGSPLQLILSSMYHIDAPTGNISIEEAKPFLREGHPLIKRSVPLSMGDSYKGFRIIGTDYSMLDLYDASIQKGKKFQHVYEVTAGAVVARKLGLDIGSTFFSSHGLNDDEDLEHEHGQFTVVGILKSTGSVVDQLLLTSSESVWDVHDHEGGGNIQAEETDSHDHEHDHDHDHEHADGNDHDHDHSHDAGHGHDHSHDHMDHKSDLSRSHLLEHTDEDITSVLIQYTNRTNFQALSMPRNINENTDLQAASPAIEINRLYDMMGVGTRALQLLAMLIAFVSAISIFVSLLNSLKQRKYELSLLRVLGGSRSNLLTLILLEGIIMAALGFVLGMLISHISLSGLAQNLTEKYNYPFTSWFLHGKESILLIASVGLGLLAALLPAIMAYKTDIHKSLSGS